MLQFPQMEFKEIIKDLRIEKGLSINQLAKQLDVSAACVSYWENGKREPNYQQIKRICKFFGVSGDFILGFDDYM